MSDQQKTVQLVVQNEDGETEVKQVSAEEALDLLTPPGLSREEALVPELEKYRVAANMQNLGGSFVQSLGDTLWRADLNNALKIKRAFPEYWQQYLELEEDE